jgi:hypothetical protein
MAEAQATFVATLDSSGIQAGAKSGLTALERLGQSIQKRSKELAAMKAAQQRLAQSAGVQEYLKRQKAIERNEAYLAKSEKRAAEATARYEAAVKAGAGAEIVANLAAEAEKAKEKVEEVYDELKDQIGKQEELVANNAAVKAYRDQGKAIKAAEGELADLQGQYSAAGGDAAALADKIEEPTQGIAKLAEQAKEAGGPFGKLGSLIESFGGSAGKMTGPLALLAVLIAIAAAAIKATIALVKFVAISADAARNAARARLNASFGSEAGSKDISSAMAALRDNTAASKEEAQALASELYRLGDRGAQLESTALTIERFGQLGDDAKSSIKGFYDELRKPTAAVGVAGGIAKSMIVTKDMLPRDVFLELANQLGKDGNLALMQGFGADKEQIRNALASIGEQRFAGPALEQMRSLDKISERLHENLQSLFEKVKIGVLLGALQKLVGLLDETSETGMAIRDVLGDLAQPVADAIESALPYLEAFFLGIIYTGLAVALMALKIKNALSDLIPESLTKNIDWLKVAFWAGAAAMGIMTAAAFALATTLFLLSLPFLAVLTVIALLVVGIVLAIDAIVGFFDQVGTALEEVDFSDAVEGITDGIIKAVEDSAAKVWESFTNLAKGGLNAFKAALGIKSPSLAFRLAGQEIPRGAALGVEDEAPALQSSVASMASPADMVAPGGGSMGNGGGIQFVIQPGAIVIQGVQGAEELEDEGFLRKLGRSLVAAAREGGLTPEPETA